MPLTLGTVLHQSDVIWRPCRSHLVQFSNNRMYSGDHAAHTWHSSPPIRCNLETMLLTLGTVLHQSDVIWRPCRSHLVQFSTNQMYSGDHAAHTWYSSPPITCNLETIPLTLGTVLHQSDIIWRPCRSHLVQFSTNQM